MALGNLNLTNRTRTEKLTTICIGVHQLGYAYGYIRTNLLHEESRDTLLIGLRLCLGIHNDQI